MKKIINFLIIVMVMISLMFLVENILCRENKDFKISLEDIYISELSPERINKFVERGKYDFQEISQEHLSLMKINPSHYKELVLEFSLDNHSSRITMEDIRINYAFSDDLKKKVVAYNDGNGDIWFFLYPENDINHPNGKSRFTQKILINTLGYTDEEIVNMFLSGLCELTYFTGPFSTTDGTRLYGVGKHKKHYKISELLSLDDIKTY